MIIPSTKIYGGVVNFCRPLGQRYIFVGYDAPMGGGGERLDYSRFSHFFNWTMTYRRDSDIFTPYGGFIKRPEPVSVEPILERVRGLPKSKMVAWIVSDCRTNSKREDYVRELQKLIPVDIFGRCGTMSCPGKRSVDCSGLLEKDYMFYLAFENTKCKDYVTEKLFFTLTMDIVPIVRGGANYSAIAPPGSYIDVNDFSSPRELAEELKRLSNAREEYLNFFRWKAETEVLRRPEDQMGCKLCKALHDKSRPAKSYQDIGAWWNASAFCQ